MSERIPLLTRLFGRARIHQTVTAGTWTKIGRGAVIAERVRIGNWSQVGEGVLLGDRVQLGDWSQVGDRSRIGPDSVFGPWARVGADVTLGARVRLGSHTRVQDGVEIPDDAVLGDGDLVTPDGIIPDRCGGFMTTILRGGAFISGPFGKFLVPLEKSDPDELTDQMVDDHQWGRSDALEPCRCFRAPTPEEEGAAFRAVRSRQKLHRLCLWPPGALPIPEPDEPAPEP